MLSLIADMMMTATRQDHNRWSDNATQYSDRFTADPHRKEMQRTRRHNPYSYFQ